MPHETEDPQLTNRAPQLEFELPHCPFCLDETSSEDGQSYNCERCEVWWDRDGLFSERTDPELPQCSAQDTVPTHGVDQVYRCVRTDGHETGTHRGYRVDQLTGQTHSWPVTS